jgi:hypothetical protein
VAIAGTGRVGTRERTGAAIGVIYVIVPAAFAFMKSHEGRGGASPFEYCLKPPERELDLG